MIRESQKGTTMEPLGTANIQPFPAARNFRGLRHTKSLDHELENPKPGIRGPRKAMYPYTARLRTQDPRKSEDPKAMQP